MCLFYFLWSPSSTLCQCAQRGRLPGNWKWQRQKFIECLQWPDVKRNHLIWAVQSEHISNIYCPLLELKKLSFRSSFPTPQMGWWVSYDWTQMQPDLQFMQAVSALCFWTTQMWMAVHGFSFFPNKQRTCYGKEGPRLLCKEELSKIGDFSKIYSLSPPKETWPP